jgi:hypothetical protein
METDVTSASDLLDPIFGGERNLTTTERALYIAGGLGLAAAAAKPRPNPLLNLIALAGGAYLVLSGYQGHCPVRSAISDAGGGLSVGHDDRTAMSHGSSRQPMSSTRNTASQGAHAS